MDVNKAIRETRDGIVREMNKSGLPLEILRLILSELLTIVANQSAAEAVAEANKENKDGSE